MKLFNEIHLSPAVIAALISALLFGASTPIAKVLLGEASPLMVAGLLYLGSGFGLLIVKIIRDRGWVAPKLSLNDWGWFVMVILFGGILGPLCLMFGLSKTAAATASLLLNLEAVLTATIAWLVFKENADKRIVTGMVVIVIGGILLALPTSSDSADSSVMGLVAIVIACLCWAVDNNLTRKIAANDALFIAGSKGAIAGVVNTFLAWQLLPMIPTGVTVAMILVCGFLGYGLSLLLFILALRGLGTARSGAYFSLAPFVGAGIAIGFFHEMPAPLFWLAAFCMLSGVWLHLTENHEHEHIHPAESHEHFHRHDQHHQHSHDNGETSLAHSHPHHHERLVHSHHHYPNNEHRHEH